VRVPPALRRVLTAAFVLAAAGFLGWRIFTDVQELRTFQWQLRPVLLVVSVALLSAVLYWGVWVWRVVLLRFGLRVPMRPLARAWFLSNLSRYVPGVVWQFVSLGQLGPAAGMNPATTVGSLLVQMGFSLLAGGMLGVWLLPAALAGPLAGALPVLRILAPLGLLLVHPAVIRRGAGLITRFAKKEAAAWQGGWGDGVLMLALSAVSWLLYGAVYFLFLRSFIDLPLSSFPAAVAVNALSFVVGYVVVFAPAGAGFKDAAMALMLGGLVPPGVAASLAVAARLWTIAAEVFPALLLARGRKADVETQQKSMADSSRTALHSRTEPLPRQSDDHSADS
jgi:hypothetical protein